MKNQFESEREIPFSAILPFPEENKAEADAALAAAAAGSGRRIIVLDDDPTGVQTVHDVSVYTDWSLRSIREGFREQEKLFFLLTNSRSFTEAETTAAHREIAAHVQEAARETGEDYLIVSRGDSTLRGHYPLETEVLRSYIEGSLSESGESGADADPAAVRFDGEILCPFFREGGRYTLGDVHYVRYGERLIPAAQTEFARDETFGYRSSNLREYVEEKTEGRFTADSCISIPNELLHAAAYDEITAKLLTADGFRKVIVNATDDYDVKVFVVALFRAMEAGKRFMIRCAAALVKALGNISTQPLLSGAHLIPERAERGGVIVVGSHTKKTTEQLERLRTLEQIVFLPLDSDLVLQKGALEGEVARILGQEERLLSSGVSVCIYTKRTLLTVEGDTPEQALLRSVAISEAVQSCVGKLRVKPAYVVAKGGITSSDVGVKALGVHRARVMGQIEPGVPVWQTGAESRFPAIPYVIFPGNVGEADTLRSAVEKLESARQG